ncbi:MAG: prolyl oligopeptidase family serine peptidase [Neisseria sp.]|nr:prolyl oligopeptidase family serine peptidase [Neisseria sp.]
MKCGKPSFAVQKRRLRLPETFKPSRIMNILYPELETLSAATVDFAAAAHRETTRQWCGDEAFAQLRDDVAAMLRDPQHIALCEEHHARMYHFLQDETYPKGVYRVASAAMYRAGAPDWEILFSVADLDDLLGDDVYLSGIAHCETAPLRVLLSLSPAGGDAAYTLEWDLARGAPAEDGFHFPLGKSTITWRDENSVWVCPAWDARQCTVSGYAREAWLLRRGQSFVQAQPIMQADDDDVALEAWRYLDAQGAPLDIACVRHGFFAQSYFRILPSGETENIPLPTGAELCGLLGGFLLLRLREDWQRSREHYLAGSLIAVKYARGALHEAFVLFRPSATQSLECVETSRRFVLVHYLDNVAGCLKAWRLQHNTWQQVPAPSVDTLTLELTDQPYGGDVFYFLAEDLLQPPVLYAWDANLDELCVMRRRKTVFAQDQLRIEQHFAQAADGSLIPYFWCGSRAAADTPTVVYAYGGFGVSTLPHHQEITGKHWLQNGGAWVIANVRGGSEFGPNWHHAAQRTHKARAAEDLLAVVRDVHGKGYTSPAHTALQGGSNGGLVVTAAMCRAPHLIGAVVAEMPLIDMLRFHRLGAGASWIEEYGDPEHETFQAALKALSPLHHLQDNTVYPPVLITTDLHDDRVHPAHALKLYARLRELGAKAYLYVNQAGGHEGNADQTTQAAEFATVFRFLRENLEK